MIAMNDDVVIFLDLESLDEELPDWEKSLIDSRLATIASQPERLKPISVLLELLKPKI